MKLSVTSPPSLGRSLANTQPVQMKICQDLLLLDRSNILLNSGFRTIHSGFKTSVKAFNHVRGSGELGIRQDSVKMIPEIQGICECHPQSSPHCPQWLSQVGLLKMNKYNH